MANQFKQGYAFLVGVGKYKHKYNYKNKEINLDRAQATADATEIKRVLIDPRYCGYPEGQVTVLQNEKATRTAILTGLRDFADQVAHQDATAILLFSGHGVQHDNSFFFTPHDVELTPPKIVPKTAISGEELLKHIGDISQKAARTLVLFHSCYSGEVGLSFAIDEDPFAEQVTGIPMSSFDDLAQGEGVAILTSSQSGELSWGRTGETTTIFVSRVIATLKGEGIPEEYKTIDLLPFMHAVARSVR